MTTSSLYGSASTLTKYAETLENLNTVAIVAAVVAICGTITLLVTFLNKKNEGVFTGFLGQLYDTLRFKKLWLRPILKATYLMATIFTTIVSFGFIPLPEVGWKYFLMILLGGNLAIRMAYEAAMMFIGIYENTKILAQDKLPKVAPKAPVQPVRPVQQVARPVQQPVQQPVQPVQQVPVQPVQPQNPVQ